MDWEKLLAAGLLIMMLVYLIPRAKQMINASPKGTSNDWMGFVLILGGIALFILLLISMVRG
jgi:hypothetical protein